MLNTKDSLILYDLLAPHLPENPSEDVIEFVRAIIDSVVESGSTDYVKAIMLMTGTPVEEIVQMDVNDALKIFIEKIIENQILSLVDFWSKVGYDYTR